MSALYLILNYGIHDRELPSQVDSIGNPLINTVYSAVQNENSQPIVSPGFGLDRALSVYGSVGCHCRHERGGYHRPNLGKRALGRRNCSSGLWVDGSNLRYRARIRRQGVAESMARVLTAEKLCL